MGFLAIIGAIWSFKMVLCLLQYTGGSVHGFENILPIVDST